VKILIVGGGPGGLYFALLAKRANPAAEIHVREQNPHGATYGWGIAMSESAIAAIRPFAPDVIDSVISRSIQHDDMEIGLEGQSVHVRGFPFNVVARLHLLEELHRYALAEGVTFSFEDRVEDPEDLSDWDLVVGADGVNSRVRELFASTFKPRVTVGKNWFAWFGTTRKFAPPALIAVSQPGGLAMMHASHYREDRSNFVVELTEGAYDEAGFAEMDEEQSRERCEKMFCGILRGEPLYSNRSRWFHPNFVRCETWRHENVTLLGDALHTVHPSIGSGTRLAMRDAVYLLEGMQGADWDIDSGLDRFVSARRPTADGFQDAAERSISWYEGLAERPPTDLTKFALDYVMRTGRVRYEQFRRDNLGLIRAYESLG
jgi:anthraniloyl-CoA monooxygenase